MCRSKAEGGRRCNGRKGRGSLSAAGSTASSAPPDPPARTRRSREALLREAQQQLGDLLDAVISAAPGAPAATVVSAVDADVAGQVADAITAALEAHGCPRRKWTSHLICSALAAVAHAMKAGEDAARAAVSEGVKAALTACGMPPRAAALAGRAATDTLMKLTPVQHWELSAARCSCKLWLCAPTWRSIPRSRMAACCRSRRTYCRLRFRRSWPKSLAGNRPLSASRIAELPSTAPGRVWPHRDKAPTGAGPFRAVAGGGKLMGAHC
jgi:hypothetical protein